MHLGIHHGRHGGVPKEKQENNGIDDEFCHIGRDKGAFEAGCSGENDIFFLY